MPEVNTTLTISQTMHPVFRPLSLAMNGWHWLQFFSRIGGNQRHIINLNFGPEVVEPTTQLLDERARGMDNTVFAQAIDLLVTLELVFE